MCALHRSSQDAASSPTASNPDSFDQSSLYSPRGDALGAGGALGPLLAVRDAEAALQLHELARGLGTAPAALVLWEELIVLYHRCHASLEDVLPRATLAQHMSLLAEAHSGHSPALAAIATRWAPMGTDALLAAQAAFGHAGAAGLRLLSGDRGAVGEVMTAHPLRIGLLQVLLTDRVILWLLLNDRVILWLLCLHCLCVVGVGWC